MAAPSSNTDIANLTCDYLGMPPVTSIDAPTTNTEKILARHYDDCRRSTLRDANWGFARSRATLARDPIAPIFDYSDRYAMPADFIRLLTINEFSINNTLSPLLWYTQYELSEGFININASGAASLQIRYIQDIVDVTKWDASMPAIVALKLAKRTCITLTNDGTRLGNISALLKEAIGDSLAIGGQETAPRRIQRSAALEARRGASRFGRSILGGTYVDFGP